jgi:hypothetical protein
MIFRTFLFILLLQNFCWSQCQTNRLLLFTAGYRLPVTKPMIINSGQGLYVEAGINPLWFAAKKIGFGVFGGYALKDNFWNTSFNSQFVSDYDAAVNTERHYSTLDSALIATSRQLFAAKKTNTQAGCGTNSFHNYSLYYGILFKVPMRAGVYVKLYTGSTRSHYRGTTEITTKGNNNIQFRRKMYGGELMLRDPLALVFKSKRYHPSLVNFGIGMYYEFIDMYTASLFFSDGDQRAIIALKQFTSSAFISKYRCEQLYGFKLSYSVL